MLACERAAAGGRLARRGRIPDEIVATRTGGSRDPWAWLALASGFALIVLWLFGPALLEGHLLYFRDLSLQYAPDYSWVARSLRQGVWPLWNPYGNAGEPFLLAYPVDLALLLVGGGRAPLGVGAALHLLVALAGGAALGRRLGLSVPASGVVGVVWGAGGFFLSTFSLVQLGQAAAWAPAVLWALLGAAQSPTGRRLALLAVLLALQVSTLGAEIVLQTLVMGGVLAARPPLWRERRTILRLLLAVVLAALLAAPAVLGVHALAAGTAREGGFSFSETLAFSVHPVALAEMVLPRLLGNPHAFSDRDFWGRAYSPTGFPYLVTIYLGLPALLLASRAGARWRLWALALAGIVVSLGSHGPLGLLAGVDAGLPFRGVSKALFTTQLALALLAGYGLDRGRHRPRARLPRGLVLGLPGVALLTLAAGLWLEPGPVRAVLGRLAPPLLDPRGLVAATEVWPLLWATSGALALLTGLLLAFGGKTARLAALAVVVDLLLVNQSANPQVSPHFYDLRPEMAELVGSVPPAAPYRWFSYGVAHTPGLLFEPVMLQASSDAALYALDRQTLLARTPALDGLEGAFDVDRTGFASPGATLTVDEAVPERFRGHHERLRLANVRWVLSFRPLPPDLVRRRRQVKLAEVQAPLHLYELRRPLPRAFWAPPGAATVAPAAAPEGRAEVRYERLDPHTVRLSASTPPGFLVVLDGHHPDWTAEDRSGPVTLERILGRYRRLPTPGGEQVFTLRYRPAWPRLAWALALLGLVGLGGLARR
jgi:hypothetical protein